MTNCASCDCYFFLQFGALHAIQKWEKKGCNLPLVLLDGAEYNMLWETIHSLPIDTFCLIFQICYTYYASETF